MYMNKLGIQILAEKSSLHLHGRVLSILKMEAACSSKMPIYQTTQHHIPRNSKTLDLTKYEWLEKAFLS